MFLATAVMADNQMNYQDNSCHLSFDANNAAHETKMGGCFPSININDDGTASGHVLVKHTYPLIDLVHPHYTDGGKLKGATADSTIYGDEYVTSNANCNMIVGNTVYRTTDSNLEIISTVAIGLMMEVTSNLSCRNGAAQ